MQPLVFGCFSYTPQTIHSKKRLTTFLSTSAAMPPLSDDPPFDIEFRTLDDDAWYTARTILTNNSLVVKFLHFDDDEDVVFEADRFQTTHQVEDLEKRFRPLSKQLQDKECRSLTKGALLCASHSFLSSDFRFYDAVLDDVVVREHRFDKAEEECTCEFLIVWKHGPCSGNLATKRVEDICVVQPEPKPDPNVAAFFMNVKQRVQNASHVPSQFSNDGGSVCNPISPHKSNSSSSTRDSLTFLQNSNQRTKLRRSPTKMQPFEEKNISDHIHRQKIREDIDMGGDNRCYLILIENLDKNLSSSAIVEFIRKETSIAVEACIFPSLSWMLYHNGVISVDCQRNLEKICKLLESPDRVVVSKGGRPCVVTGKLSQYDLTADPILASMLKYQENSLHRNLKIDDGLKVVYSGSEEYETAVQLKGIYLEFVKHQESLQKGLAMEESRVLHPSHVS